MAATHTGVGRTAEADGGTARGEAEADARLPTMASPAHRRQHTSESASGPLPAREQRFVDEYLVDLNATRAATAAGYRATSARFQGSRLLAKRRVADALQTAMAARAARTGITADRVV